MLDDTAAETEILRVSIAGDVEHARELLEIDPSLACLRTDRWTPLHLAAEYDHLDLLEVLLDKGAPIDAPISGFESSPLHVAARRGHTEAITLLIERGADPNVIDVNRDTPLHYAVKADDGNTAGAIRALLRGGAHPDGRDMEDCTPLQHAACDGNLPMVQLLLEFGADANGHPAERARAFFENPDKWPLLGESTYARPLYAAVCSASIEVVDLLLDSGADINALSFGWSALHAAAARPNPAMVEHLLRRGADLFVKSADGRTPIEMLAGFRRTAQLLRAVAPDAGRAD